MKFTFKINDEFAMWVHLYCYNSRNVCRPMGSFFFAPVNAFWASSLSLQPQIQHFPLARWKTTPLFTIYNTIKFSSPTGGFFYAPAEGFGPTGSQVILADGQTNGRTDTGLRELYTVGFIHLKLSLPKFLITHVCALYGRTLYHPKHI